MDNQHKLNQLTSKPLFSFLIIVAFVIVKLNHIGVSFFWDESWVYAPALRIMAENGPSLIPDAIPLEYSRGHPLLFHFLGGVWIKIFGPSNSSMHLFALSISIGFLLIARQFLSRLFSHNIAFWVLLILCFQNIFLAQSSMVLPEMLLATLSLGAVYFYWAKNKWLYFIMAALAILTKETGILVVISIVSYDVFINLINKEKAHVLIKSALTLSLPLIVLIVHMLYLKSAFGWYLYPEHTGMVNLDIISIFKRLGQVIADQILIQKRSWIALPFILLYIFDILKSQKFFNYIFLFVSVIICAFFYMKIGQQFALSNLFILLVTHWMVSKLIIEKNLKEQPLILFFIFILAYGLFSAANFYTVRYLLSTLIFTLIIPIYYLLEHSALKKFAPYYFLAIMGVFIANLYHPKDVNDVNLTYLNYSPVQSEVVSYFENENLYDAQINTMFLCSVALSDQYAGYRNTKTDFTFVNKENNQQVDYYIFYNIEDNPNRDRLIENNAGTMVKRIEKGNIWFEIWKEETKTDL